MMLRIVGGTDRTPEKSRTETRPVLTDRDVARYFLERNTTKTNKRLREQRYDIWRKAEAATSYWRAMMDLQQAILVGQNNGIIETSRHPKESHGNWFPLLESHRNAEVKQLLTPAPTAALLKWKQQVFAQGQYKYTDVKKEQIEKAIADDLAFLAAHAPRRARSDLP
jgi:hypothetical protein